MDLWCYMALTRSIDDATSTVVGARFDYQETFNGYKY